VRLDNSKHMADCLIPSVASRLLQTGAPRLFESLRAAWSDWRWWASMQLALLRDGPKVEAFCMARAGECMFDHMPDSRLLL
jgi:hypothetical protein